MVLTLYVCTSGVHTAIFYRCTDLYGSTGKDLETPEIYIPLRRGIKTFPAVLTRYSVQSNK